MIDLTEFFSIQNNLLRTIPHSKSRFLKERIRWNQRMVGIVGGRGTGKTTLLLQHMAESDEGHERHLYIAADHIHVQATGLYDIGASFYQLGGDVLTIDEIHKYPKWSQEVKNLYDAFPNGKIHFSGSSTLALQKGKGDLSRRVVFYNLPGLSFREYLRFSQDLLYEPVTLSDLLKNHVKLATMILKQGPVLRWFRDYLEHGVYPFFLEGIDVYHHKLSNVIEKVLYEDIPAATGTKTANVPTLKRILWLIATSQPFTPNIEKMSRDLKISKTYIYTYLDFLERATLLSGFPSAETGYRLVRKPSKIYMENPNLIRQVAGELGLREASGAVRETFFAHQLRSAGLTLSVPNRGDFLVENRYLFEIGGKGKGKKQIRDTADGFVVKDDIETGFGSIIPLWLFGFLY